MADPGPADDSARVREAVESDLKVHVRLTDQGLAPDDAMRKSLMEALPDLSAFGDHRYHAVTAVLDWDHQIPSEFTLLRIYASYDERDAARVNKQVGARDRLIRRDNLYPEFDVPDYGELAANETYIGVFQAGTAKLEEFRLLSNWRKQVSPETGRSALATVKASSAYKKAVRERNNDALGGAVVVGWAPPCAANTSNWAVEIWLITAFDGQMGTARVFMVDSVTGDITREHETTVQVS